MNGDIVKNKQMKLHIENKNEILRELNGICMNQTQCLTYDLDSPKDYLVETNEKLSPIVEDLLMDMNEKKLKKLDEYNNSSCYRCRHFLNTPQSLSKSVEEISSSTKEYEDNLAFVQAIVWLKSAIKSTKNISIEQFHLAFYKQWNNVEKGNDFERRNRSSEVPDRNNKSINVVSFDANQKYATFANTSVDSSSIDLSWDVNDNMCNKSRNDCDEELIRSDNRSSPDSSSLERYFQSSQQNEAVSGDYCVIPESSSDCFSESDRFGDASQSQTTDVQNETGVKSFAKSSFAVEQSANIVSPCISFSQKSFSRAKNSSGDSSGDESSDATVFNEDCSARKRTIDDLRNDESKRFSESGARVKCVKTFDSGFTKIPSVSANKIGIAGSPPFDSGYDTNALVAEHFVSQNDDHTFSSQRLDFLTPLHQNNDRRNSIDSEESMFTTIADEKNGERKLYSSSSKLSSKNKTDEDAVSHQQSGHLEKNERNVDFISVEDVKEKKVSSQLLSFTLNALNVDDVAFRSVKIILAIFQDETIAEQYMRKRYWENTLEAEAVNAILDFQIVFEAENKTDACTQEILQAVTNALEKCIENTELNKTSILIHQISIILKFCDSMPICIETINYLTAKLKSQETVLTTLMSNKKAEIHNVINQLHMIFYALRCCLEKYRLAFLDVEDEQFVEVIPSVTNLWKNQSKVEGVMVKDTVYNREKRWSAILDDFIVVAIDNFLHFAEKLRRLNNMLTRK